MGDRENANKVGGASRDEEATSSETLGDLEQTESDTAPKSSGTPSGESGGAGSSTPSPDGAFDSPRGGRADGSDAGEPM